VRIADVNRQNNDGHSLFHLACRYGKRDVTEYLLEGKQRLVDDIEHRARYGETPLYLACKHGHLDVVQCLAELGANVNLARNCTLFPMIENGETPLYIACHR
jgi:ankyrin repeat protein